MRSEYYFCMTTNIIAQIESLDRERDALLTMHHAATQALDSTRCGGWATFRTDGLTDEQALELPAYVGRFVGSQLPLLYSDEDGSLKRFGGRRVDERHTRFSAVHSFYNEHLQTNSHVFRWDKALWDPEVAEAEQVLAEKAHSRKLLRKAGILLAFATTTAVEGTGLYMMLKGVRDVGQLRREGAPQAVIDEATEDIDFGMKLSLVPGFATAAGMTGYLDVDVVRRNNEDQATQTLKDSLKSDH